MEVLNLLKNSDIRGLVDERNEKIGKKISDAEMDKITFMLIIGDSEMQEGKVAVRKQGQGDLGVFTPEEFVQIIQTEINEKLITF